jgi:hypothetical protein
MHEVAYHVRCSDGTGFSATLLTPIGTAGELVVGCNREIHIPAGTANPSISPDGGGKRAIPEASCIEQRILNPEDGRPRFDSALRESWEISGRLRTHDNRTLASFNPYFQVMDPSRFFDTDLDRDMGRPIDLCFRPELIGEDRCEAVGTDDVNATNVRNADGPNWWYTDALGRNGRTEPFPGSIRQWVASHDNNGLNLHGGIIGRDRDYNGPGVRAPN